MPTPTYGNLNAPRGAVQSLNWVWDAGTLDWVPETQPGGGGGGGAVTVADGADVTLGNTTTYNPIVLAAGTVTRLLQGLQVLVSGVSQATYQVSSEAILTNIQSDLDFYTTALDYSGSNPIYIGKAVQGSAKASAVWQIRKLTFDGSNNMTDIQYANGSLAFNAIWNNRAALSYS